MSEYVIEVEYDTLNGTFSQKRHEEIVRCRDCSMCVEKGYRLYCDRDAGGFPEVEADGFCAWACRKEQQ